MNRLIAGTVFFLSLAYCCSTSAQSSLQDTLASIPKLLSLEPAPNFDKKRFWAMAGTGTAAYAGLSTALWSAWYKDYPLTKFHGFDDLDEWNQMDKAGHFFSTWMACNYAFEGARWTGMSRRSALWTSVGVGLGILSTIEVMDGFSEEWGFSSYDMGFNLAGAGLFAGQELAWQEQRIQLKVSGIRPGYPQEPLYSADGTVITTLDQRAAGLYGTTFFSVLLKDYNALTVWSSVNIHSFLPNKSESKFPKWLNLALGYGAGNMYGGVENKWESEDGVVFELDPVRYPRYRQCYLSLDVDWTRIPTRHRWLRAVLKSLNFLKMPAPAFELNSLGKARFHYLHW
ncbi:MAG: YfiM family protein [Saprospiraceae bacterium]|nr:YfiM family protein [Saprospiraceae bacterium]